MKSSIFAKTTALLLIASTSATCLFASRPAHAVMGFLSANAVMAIAGAGGIAAGLGLIQVANDLDQQGRRTRSKRTVIRSALAGVSGTVLFLGGFFLLDKKERAIRFEALTPEAAERLGITETEREVFNSEVDELNAIRNSVEARLAETESPSVGQAEAIWSEYSGLLSPETESVTARLAASDGVRKLLKKSLRKY